jgi:hypothetical protein
MIAARTDFNVFLWYSWAIVRDTEFKSANAMLGAKLKFNLRNGLSRPTQHPPIISNQELMQINTYLSKKEDIVATFTGVVVYQIAYIFGLPCNASRLHWLSSDFDSGSHFDK